MDKISLVRSLYFYFFQKYLRDALQEIARMHTSGPHRNHWELKPEFKTVGEAGGAAGGGDGVAGDG